MKVYVVYSAEPFDFRVLGVYLRKKVVDKLYDGHVFVKVCNLIIWK